MKWPCKVSPGTRRSFRVVQIKENEAIAARRRCHAFGVGPKNLPPDIAEQHSRWQTFAGVRRMMQ
jgi:hypothetical protein